MTINNSLLKLGKTNSTKSYQLEDLPSEYNKILPFFTSNKNSYFMLIRFPNAKKEIIKKILEGASYHGFISPLKKRCYKFSPLQLITIVNICKSIEFQLSVLTQAKPHKSVTLIHAENNEIIITDSDGLHFLSYSLSKRAELYSKFPEIDKNVFGINFIKFAKWVINKESDSEGMKRNAEKTRKILKKFNINIFFFIPFLCFIVHLLNSPYFLGVIS